VVLHEKLGISRFSGGTTKTEFLTISDKKKNVGSLDICGLKRMFAEPSEREREFKSCYAHELISSVERNAGLAGKLK
jgi:hypothetical protein